METTEATFNVPTSDQLLSRRAVAAHFSVCTETIKRWEKRGYFSPIRINPRVVRYRLSDICPT